MFFRLIPDRRWRFANHRIKESGRCAFTLLEVMMGVMILSIITLCLHRFIAANLTAMGASTEAKNERQAISGVTNLLQEQIGELAPRGQGLLLGTANKFNNLS